MPNELDLKNPQFLDEMDEEQEDQLFSIMLAKRQQRTEKSVKALFDAFNKQSETIKHELETIKLENQRQNEDYEKQLTLERKRHRIEESRYGYVSLRDLGAGFEVPIGAANMGKLLKIVGLAIRSRGSTEPYMEVIRNGTAKNKPYKDHVHYQWNPEKTVKKIDDWLEENGHINDFYSCENQKELYLLINELYSIYVEGGR